MNMVKVFFRKVIFTVNKLIPLPTPIFRLCWRFFYQKESFVNWNSQMILHNVFDEIYRKKFWESEESYSGGGSTLKATQTIREKLEFLFVEKEIKTMLDIPCGDYNWMREVDKSNIKYIGADIVEDLIEQNKKCFGAYNISFLIKDLTRDPLPNVDLVFCKDCLQHLSYINIKRAINNIRNSGSKYLLVTTYPKTWKNWDILDGDYRPLNLRKYPLNFPKPELKILEQSKEEGVEIDKTMYLYKVSDLPLYSDL